MKVELFSADLTTVLPLPYADMGVRAGFPSPAQDYMTESIDLNRDIIKHRATTFYARCVGDSMREAGIDEGDILVIDKSLEAKDGDIVIAFLDGEFTVKRLKADIENGKMWLIPENPNYSPIEIHEDNSFMIWGVVTHNIKSLHRPE